MLVGSESAGDYAAALKGVDSARLLPWRPGLGAKFDSGCFH